MMTDRHQLANVDHWWADLFFFFFKPAFVLEWDGTLRFKTPFCLPAPHVASVVNGRKVLGSFSQVSRRRRGVSGDRKPAAGAV